MAEEKLETKSENQINLENEEINFSDEKNIDIEEVKVEEVSEEVTNENSSEQKLEISDDLAEEKLNEVMSLQKPKTKKKNTIVTVILLLINIGFMIFIVSGLVSKVGEQNFFTYIKSQGSRLWWLVGGVLCYALYMFSQTIMFHTLVKSITGKSQWKLSYNVGITGKYYDNVTPFAVGGQPMQIVTLSKSGISPGASTSIPIIKMLINGLVSTLLALLFFVVGLHKIEPTNSFFAFLFIIFEILGVIGLVITLFASLFMIILSSGSLFTRSLVAWLVKVGYKLKIVKNYRVTLKKWLGQVNEYKASGKFLIKNKKVLVKMILYSCLESLSYAGISFFVVMAFMNPTYMVENNIGIGFILLSCIVKYYICSMAGSYIPLPGATGLMEIAFIALYGEFVGDAIVWALLTWRIVSYYFILIHGFINEITKIAKNVSKSRREKKMVAKDVSK
jgi:uncharacterized protein (TIRG00374 family)